MNHLSIKESTNHYYITNLGHSIKGRRPAAKNASRAELRPVWSSLVRRERPLLERRDHGVAETDADGGHDDLHDGRGGRLGPNSIENVWFEF